MSNLYHEDLLAELDNLHNVGELSECDASVSETNASCGDEVSFNFIFEEKNAELYFKEVKWQGKGCSISQVSCSQFSEFIKDKSVAEVLNLSQQDLEKLLGLSDISVGRVKCLLLPLTAIKKLTTQLKK